MADADDLLTELRAEGFSVRAEGGRLLVAPLARLRGDLLDRVRAGKDALLAALEAEARGEQLAAAALAVGAPDFDERGPVVLESYETVVLTDRDGSAEYLAVPAGWLDGLRELAALKRADKARKNPATGPGHDGTGPRQASFLGGRA
jgi:hypothetical protein